MDNDPVEEGDDTTITFDYQDLEITNGSIRLGWTVTKQFACSQRFEIQRILRVNSPTVTSDIAIRVANSTNAVIPLNNSFSTAYFRIVAVSENSSICSDSTSEETLYYFGSTYGYVLLCII